MFIRYSDELIEEIRINNDIVDVVSEYVRLEKRGKNYFGLCPFHREKTPSFSVEDVKQIFYCFGCGKGGNVFQFITLAEKIDFIDAVRHLADRAKIELPESDDAEEVARARQKQQVSEINLLAARYYNDVFNSDKGTVARDYLKRRDISVSTAKKFGLGYSPDQWDSLYEHLKASGSNDELMLKSGLIQKSAKGQLYDRFRGRLMFPIFDVRGLVIGFGGRVLDDSLPKYMNSPETVVYNKGKHLYALNFAKNADSEKLVVVEGYMDVISLYQSGINNVVASLGTALTESQGRLLKKYAQEIVISYDSDKAGQAATQRGLDLLNSIGCNVKVLTVPDGKDPDGFIRKSGPDSFKRLIEGSLTLIEYKIRVLRQGHDLSTTDGKIAFLNKAALVLAKVDNAVEREMYIKKLSAEYEISEEAMLSEVLRRTRRSSASSGKSLKIANAVEAARKSAAPVDEVQEKILQSERFILSLLCVDNSIYPVLKEHFKVNEITGDENKRIAQIIYTKLNERKDFTPAELMNVVSSQEAGEFARVLKEECHCDDNSKAVLGKIKEIGILKAERRQKQVLELLRNTENLSKGDVDKLKLELRDLILKIKNMKDMPI
ncbi:MAG: DNA primase [Clostridiaceae bacterium]|nr:DNA primase [Clostridiaceae bacterium]